MDRQILVEEKIDDGQRVLEALGLTNHPARVAAWLKLTRNDFWTLFLGFDAITLADNEATRRIYEVATRTSCESIDVLTFRYGSIDASVYAELLAIRDRYPTMIARKLKTRRRIGDEDTRGMYLYPASFDLPAPDQVVHSVLGLLDRSGTAAPSVVTFRDGSRVHAVPVGIRLNTPDGARIDWHDVVTGQDRTVPAAEVVSIL